MISQFYGVPEVFIYGIYTAIPNIVNLNFVTSFFVDYTLIFLGFSLAGNRHHYRQPW